MRRYNEETETLIILYTSEYNETHTLLKVYSAHYGYFTLLCDVSVPRGDLNLLSVFTATFRPPHPPHQMGRLRLIESRLPTYRLRNDWLRSSITIFLTEILQRVLFRIPGEEAMLDFLIASIHELIEIDETRLAYFPQRFLIALTQPLGFYPRIPSTYNNECFNLASGTFQHPTHDYKSANILNIEDSQTFYTLLTNDTDALAQLRIPARQQLLKHLLHYLELHLDIRLELRSLEVFHSIMN